MTDLIVRGLPPETMTGIDRAARRQRLSRSEFLRRDLARRFGAGSGKIEPEDWIRFDEAFADLGDPGVMAAAWR